MRGVAVVREAAGEEGRRGRQRRISWAHREKPRRSSFLLGRNNNKKRKKGIICWCRTGYEVSM